MKVQQYLDKIKTLSIKNSRTNFDDVDLGNHVKNVFLENKSLYFNVSVLFPELLDHFQESLIKSIIVDSEIIKQIADHLGLLFINERIDGNVCFADNIELRPEFRQSFTSIDVLDYCVAISYFNVEALKTNSTTIPITSDVSVFWQLVNFGRMFRKTY